ncbi:MAG: sigma-70 family RNA polymerase sigma factor [Burkholderiaceae bacterium]|jgi:RNA polymerase sigma-70 factor (ECF subfamily)
MTQEKSPLSTEIRLKPLWFAAQSGDEQAYAESLLLMARQLRGYFRRRMPALANDVEDLVQETLLAVHLQRGTYDPTYPVTAWLLAIARHKLVDHWRRRGRRENLHEVLDDLDAVPVAEEQADAHAARDLSLLLLALPVPQRQAIELTKLEGLSIAEASTRTGLSESSIKVLVHRGLKRLSELVKE